MKFQKGNKLGAKKFLARPLDESLSVRLYQGQKDYLRAIPDWQERLREKVDQLIEEHKTGRI